MVNLPIDIISGSNKPMRFRWYQMIEMPSGGARRITHEGLLSPTVEGPVAELIRIVRQQQTDIDKLRKQVNEMVGRIAVQSEELSKQAQPPAQPISSSRKGRG